MAAAPAQEPLDHTAKWTGDTSLTYNLVNLEHQSEWEMFDAPANEPSIRWGNIQSRFNVTDPGNFPFTKRTLPPFSNANEDLFVVSESGGLHRVRFEGAGFPSGANWTVPQEFGGISGNGVPGKIDSINEPTGILVRYLHFKNELLNEIPEPRQPLGESTTKVVVLIHGWNPESAPDAFATAEFTTLKQRLETKLTGTDWSLVLYHWEADADTGSIEEAAVAPVKAAHNAHKHGQHLGELLATTCPNLKSVHLIAHSAGSWAARSAAHYLMERAPKPKVQVTLLDPFMPAELPVTPLDSGLGRDVMSLLDETLGNSNRLWRLENFYSQDTFTGAATQQVFDWRAPFENLRIDWTSGGNDIFDTHAGPIQFLADTIYGIEGILTPYGTKTDDSLGKWRSGSDNTVGVGWFNSLFRNEPIFAKDGQPVNKKADVGWTVEFTASARTRNVNADAGIGYEWLVSMDGGFNWSAPSVETGITGGATATMRIESVTSGMSDWRFRVRIFSNAGEATSNPVKLVMAGAPVITVQPFKQSVVHAGSTIELSVTATGVGTLAYQWEYLPPGTFGWLTLQDSPGSVSGAATRVLQLSNISADWNGYQFRALVSNELGSTESDSAWLNIALDLPSGRLFQGDWGDLSTDPNYPPGLGKVVKVDSLRTYFVALLSDGTLVDWGTQLGDDGDLGPIPDGLGSVVDFAIGYGHAVALKQDGTVVCWGRNNNGQATPPPGLGGVVSVAAGENFSLALRQDGTVVQWGTIFGHPTPPGLSGLNIKRITASGYSAFALKDDGTVFGWGYNYEGHISSDWFPGGYAETTVKVLGEILTNVVAIDTGPSHAVALKGDGTVVAWGQQSTGGYVEAPTPAPAETFGAIAIAAGNSNSAVLMPNGDIIYWGTYSWAIGRYHHVTDASQIFVLENYQIYSIVPDTAPVFKFPINDEIRNQGWSWSVNGEATGYPQPAYQWYRNGIEIPGATYPSFSISAVQLTDEGLYTVHAWNSKGSVTAQTFLTVDVPPSFTGSPSNQIVGIGETVTWTASGTGKPEPTFLWRKGGVDILGATTSTFSMPSAAISDSGSYTVEIRNRAGFVESFPWTLDVVVRQPQITQQPQPMTVTAGQLATFTAAASGTAPFTYQWRKDGSNIPGATQNSLVITNAQLADEGQYSVYIKNDYGETVSSGALLTVQVPPTFTAISFPSVVSVGQPVLGTVSATAKPDPSFQWRKNGADIPGATGTQFYIAGATVSDSGSYSVFISNPAGQQESPQLPLTVQVPPAFTTHPASQMIIAGNPVTFTAAATGLPAPAYQWKFNGAEIPGATGASYTINSVIAQNAGNYSVVATNSIGSVTSNAATLTVNSPPVFTAHPAGLVRNVTQSAQFSATATGTPTPTYQWKKDGVNIPGATAATFFIPAVFPGNAGTYTVVATNVAGSATSNAATLTVNIAPAFTSHPASQTKTVGQSVIFSTSASGVPAPTYQWRKDGANISGATSDSFTIPSVALASAGSYDVVATNAAGSATSNTAVLTVNPAAVPPSFTLHPVGKNVIAGQPIVFTSVATGDPTPTYQWRRNGVNIPGATGSSFSIAATATDEAGNYSVIATNSAGSATSNAAILTVSTVGAAAVAHAIGDLPGGAVFSQIRDATKVGGVIYAVGSSSMNGSALGDTAVLWTSTGGLTPLPNLVVNTTGLSFVTASAITPDAAFIASRARNAPTGGSRTAVRVTRDGLVNLDLNAGTIPGLSAAVSISSDGSVLYGLADNLNQAARFTAAGPTATLIPFPTPENDRSAPAGRGTSADGSVMVGTAATFAITGGNSIGPGNSAFRYLHGTGTSAIPMPAGGTWSGAHAISPDGILSLVYGDSTATPNGGLYIHNATTNALSELGSPALGWVPGNFGGMSADGAIAVTSFGDPNGSQRASFVHNSHGWHDLQALIAAKGIELDGWESITVLGMSPDATLLFGSAIHMGAVEGWVVEFAPGDLAAYQGEPPATTIAGTWSIGDTDGAESSVLVLNEDGTYFFIEDHSSTAGGASVAAVPHPMAAAVSNEAFGYETGTYTWNSDTGALTVTTLLDTNGTAGLSGINGLIGVTASVLGGTLTLHVPDPDGGDYTLARATDESPITGAWIVGDPDSANTLTVVVFLSDGTYYILSDGADNDPSGQDGIEHGTYTWDPTTGALTATVLFDSNGEWGLSDNDGPVAVFVEGGALVAGAHGGPVLAVSASIPAVVAPVINEQPEGRSVGTGQPASFSVTAVGTSPFTYQWFKNDSAITGATSATYSIASAQAADAATYSVVVTNPVGSESSNGAVLAVTSSPAITAQPVAKAVVNGATVTFEIAATGTGPFVYQWRRNGVGIPGASQSALTLSSVTAANAGSYSVVVTNAFGTVISSAAALAVGSDSRLTNISTRAFAGGGDATLVVGFYIAGSGSKTLVIRGIGPKLGDFIPGPVVTDPSITVYDSNQQVVATNNDWDSALSADFGVVGAFGLNAGSKDAALKLTLPTGGYTVHLVNPGAVAEAMIEVYDRSKDAGTRLVNLSCRMKIAAGQNVIVGTYLDGGPANLVVRNIGPGVAPYLPEPDRPFVAPDPMLRFYNDADALTGENDDWDTATRAFFGPVGAFDLPDGSKDAAARLSLPPGRYSIHASGNTTGGTLLVELYQAP